MDLISPECASQSVGPANQMFGSLVESVLRPECAATSVGPANQLFTLLIQTILTTHCSISPTSMWPEDYGLQSLEKGISCTQ